MKKITRRNFIKTSGLVTLAGLGGVQVGFGSTRGSSNFNTGKDLLVYVFLNGGMDGLNMVPPRSGSDYTRYSTVLRPNLHISNSGADASIALGSSGFGMHPSAPEMATLFDQNKMAIVHATGLVESNRSHFVATAMMEFGTQSQNLANEGWLTRYFNASVTTSENAEIPLLVPSYNNPDAVLGNPAALVMGNPGEFSLNSGHWQWEDVAQDSLAQVYSQPDTLEKLVGNQTLNASAIVTGIEWDNYSPGGGAVYPDSDFGQQLKTVAQLHKENHDLEVAYIPYGGWDTHTNQGTGTEGVFSDLAGGLSQGLNALYRDLNASHPGRFTIIVQSEFGRRAYQNGDNSTDHGYGNPMFIIGDNVNGGFHGNFPGLGENDLFEGQDVNATVDYRDIVSEILMKRMRNKFLGYIFPGYSSYTPIGVVNGASLEPVFETNYDPLFSNGFD
ncbi:DUF1501 domain-containing protein [Marinicella sp. W31]|uniref:DUF1501 domain-containing protein n=1 Tax=Marinicella sp. W31 TaxID=3023713 RepID=UPI003756B8F1